MKTKRPLISYTDDMLQEAWVAGFEQRVKTGYAKGCITQKATRFGDVVLREAEVRGIALRTPVKYQ